MTIEQEIRAEIYRALLPRICRKRAIQLPSLDVLSHCFPGRCVDGLLNPIVDRL
jgi:hypothetical protein